ncbi:ABC transporter [Novimethylophilus kurashikiensis]|uniref:ABC transporter n=1 Tax=Novimethylophilus kurashikiensis TaxID=1825523 RepID=A0A2R5FBZ3_9PROT|nr:hypothetical protein [Novimethylophilus kurashikiensis]GBG14443.1 ABC transporter [Novimethylophilus kurashikiensis]
MLFPSVPVRFVSAVRAAYREPHRHFHCWGHIQHLVKTARQLNWKLRRAEQLAVLCHDLVYVPGAPAGSNELASIEAMDALLVELKVAVPLMAKSEAKEIIMATVDHRPSFIASRVCDLDLAILGGTPAAWTRYRAAVRAEYPQMSDAQFNEGSQAFLAGMLARQSIYQTPEAIARFEARARENISRELAALAE